MAEQTITITVDVKELLTGFIPKLAKQYMALGGLAEELKGTELTLNVDVSGQVYGYHIKDGVDFDVTEGALDNPMVQLGISLETMEKLADMKNIDMLINMQGQLSKQKNDVIKGLKGTGVFQLKNGDGAPAEITATFNGAETPKATISLAMEDAAAVSSGQESPIQLFMNGRLGIEGDMSFAMGLQPLLT